MMKNKVHQFRSVLILILTNLLISSSIFAQSTEKMSYQAVIRNSSDALLTNTQVGMKISILQGSETGTVVYTEKQTPTTNANGLISIEIGGGKVEAGVFQSIDWSVTPCFIKIETDLTGGSNYTITGTNQLLSVPYALHAKTAEAISGSASLIGANIGDMQYWNGTEWAVLSAGRAGQFLFFNSSNLPEWQSVASPSRLYPPLVELLPPSNIESFDVQFNGIVNARGLRSDIVFEWGTTPDYGQIASAIPDIVTGIESSLVSTSLSGLESNTTYHYRIKATNAVDVTYSEDMSFNISIPQLTTNIITDNLGFSATGGGSITYDGGSPVTARGICWSTDQLPTISDSKTEDSTGIGTFISSLTGLELGTTYYVRAYATNSVATVYGNEITFTSFAFPTLTTSIAYDIRGNSAKAGGRVTSYGGTEIIEQGLCWSTSVNPTIADSITLSLTGVMTELSSNTTYYVRAYATNIAGTGYGNEISFNSGKIIGSSFGGGLVFYNDGAGHGLICAETDQSNRALWGCYGDIIGGTSTGFNRGAANTRAIVAGCSKDGIAAKLCYDLNLNSYSDWFLPSRDELSLMHSTLYTQGLGGFKDGFYWSSSEYDNNYAWLSSLQTGKSINYFKSLPYSVRAVRTF